MGSGATLHSATPKSESSRPFVTGGIVALFVAHTPRCFSDGAAAPFPSAEAP